MGTTAICPAQSIREYEAKMMAAGKVIDAYWYDGGHIIGAGGAGSVVGRDWDCEESS